MSEDLTLRPIGRIRTEFPEKFGIPRQSGLVEELRAVVDQLNVGFGDGVTYEDIARRLLFGDGGMADEYLLLADFESYRDAHVRAGLAYRDPKRWNKMALMNIARSGIFAADRSIADYADTIWHVPYKK